MAHHHITPERQQGVETTRSFSHTPASIGPEPREDTAGERGIKSLLIASEFPSHVGGISHFMGSLAAVLGPDRVCCLTDAPANDGALNGSVGPRVYRRPSAFAESKYIQAVGWAAAVAQIVIREKPRIVQLGTVAEGYMGLWLREWLKLPFVVYAHGNEILEAMRGRWPTPRRALCQADRVLANSRFTAQLVQRAGVAPERIEIVHPGCEVGRFRPLPPNLELRQRLLGDRHGNRVILTVGRLVARKGHDMVIRALPQLLKLAPEVTYLIVGDGPYRAQLEALTAATGVQDHVVFAGEVSAEELPDVYALSDVFVMPSREQLDACDVEGFGLVFLEASACQKPVVGGRSGGIPDAIVDGETGFLVDPHDPENIARALAQVLTDSDLATRFGQQGRLRAVQEFTWTRVGERVQRILGSVLREYRQSSTRIS